MLTAEKLKKITHNTPVDRCALFVDHINEYCPKYGIDTVVELASFLSQVLHESGGLKYMREIWGPTAAQCRYEGRADLGNIYKGDGKKFMGRGPIQITGRKNYERMSFDMFGDSRLVMQPDILSTPQYGVQAACIYWQWRKLDKVDDDLSIKEETKSVNGGYNGILDREHYFKQSLIILQDGHNSIYEKFWRGDNLAIRAQSVH